MDEFVLFVIVKLKMKGIIECFEMWQAGFDEIYSACNESNTYYSWFFLLEETNIELQEIDLGGDLFLVWLY